MTRAGAPERAADGAEALPDRIRVITALGVTQILAWGSSYYLLAMLARPIADDTGWPLSWTVGGLSLGLLIAAMVSPQVGRTIEARGGRPVLAASALLLALGQLGLALAPGLPLYIAAWVIMGVGMGAGLYDAAFATLGRLYGRTARQAITTLTLFGGFASTVCWPLSAFLVSEIGWRGTCLIYAAIQLLIAVPLYLTLLPRRLPLPRDEVQIQPAADPAAPLRSLAEMRLIFALLALVITLSAVISTTMSVHLFTILQAHGMTLAAVALGAMIGPSQVAARAIEMLIARHHHPIWTKMASVAAVMIGLGALWAGVPLVALTLVFYGAGIGLESIARGTLPLSLFGAQGYAAMMGRLAMPSLIAQAVTPSLGAMLAGALRADGLLGVLVALSVLNVLLAIALWVLMRPKTARFLPTSAGRR